MRNLRIHIFLLAILALLSCEKSSDLHFKNDGRIVFSLPQTKAAIADVDGMTARPMSVSGIMSKNENMASATSVFASTAVSYGAGNVWPSGKNWVSTNHYRFRAIWPADVVSEYSDNLDNSLSFTFTPDNDPENQVDLLLSNLTTSSPADREEENPVILDFNHLLSKIHIKINKIHGDADVIEVKNVRLFGLIPSGTYKNDAWTVKTNELTKQSFERVFSTPAVLSDEVSEAPYLDIWSGGLLLIPQPLTNKAIQLKLSLTYDITHGLETTHYINREIALPSNIDWQPSMTYTYKLTISQKYDIVFASPTIDAWGEEKIGASVIIKR